MNERPPVNRELIARVPAFRIAISVMLIGCLFALPARTLAADPVRPVDRPVSPFGIGPCSMRSQCFPTWIPQMVEIGVTDVRCFGGSWGCEPEQGKFNWKVTDERLDYLESQNVHAGALLMGRRPKWLTNGTSRLPPSGLPLDCLPEWSNYVSNMVAHTKGRVKYFEVWNEPPNGTKNAPPSDYAKVMVASYDAAKSSNPDALVGLATKSVYLYYLDAAIKAGAKGHYDYITLHPYEVLGTVASHPGTEPLFLTIASKVRKMLAAQDPAKVNVPIFFTEIGYDAKRSAAKQAQALVKTYTMGIAQGIACIQWFEGRDGDSGPMGLMDAKGNKRPSYTALSVMIRYLGKYPRYLGWVLLNDKHYAFVFQGANGVVLITWAATATPDEVEFDSGVEYINPQIDQIVKAFKVPLTADPIIIEKGVPDKLVAQAKANKTKPFPWGGDYTDAKSVSVTMGAKNVEKGLHTLSADSIAADVVLYGGNARAGNVPGGNAFLVDPNFLSYDTVPVEITAVVRRNEQNDPFKLTLQYESTSGYKDAKPYDIPDNQEWHKATWRIDDPQFVASWAFDFRINSGKYCIQSVTVTKLAK
ncbi:MAG: hypothetical protein WCS52_01355 [bacterium]